MKKVARIVKFLKYSKNKKIMVKALCYSAYYRFCILFIPANKNKKWWGVSGEESPQVDTEMNYHYAARVCHCVNRVCDHTWWQSKCLVRALTTQRLLCAKKIASTMYLGLGCEQEDGELIAHAWLRCGKYYIMGGNGNNYVVVEKFRK